MPSQEIIDLLNSVCNDSKVEIHMPLTCNQRVDIRYFVACTLCTNINQSMY